MRKVSVIINLPQLSIDGNWLKQETKEGVFHQFSVGYRECGHGAGSFATAIVEWADGSLDNVPVERVKFI